MPGPFAVECFTVGGRPKTCSSCAAGRIIGVTETDRRCAIARHARRRLIPAVAIILLFVPAVVFTQNISSNPKQETGSPRSIRQNVSDPEMDAISKAEQEGRLLDAEKLLAAAVQNAESNSSPPLRMSVLLKSLTRVEFDLGHFSEAISAMQKELKVDKALYHPESAKVLIDLNALAVFNRKAGNQAAADQAIGEALALARKFPGPHQVTLITALWEASQNDRQANRKDEAQALLAEGAQICQAPGTLQTNICPLVLSNYYRETGEGSQAEKILSEAAAQRPVDDHGHADYSYQLNALGQLAAHYRQEGSYNLAEATYQKAIAVAQNHIPNPLVAPDVYYEYGRLLEIEGKNKEAEAAYKRAFDALETIQGRFQLEEVQRLSAMPLVRLYEKEGRTSEAEALLERTLAHQEQVLDPHDEHLARTLMQLADLKVRQGEYSDAEPLCERALKIQEADFGPDNPQLMQALCLYASIERQLRNTDKADALAARAAALRRKWTVRR